MPKFTITFLNSLIYEYNQIPTFSSKPFDLLYFIVYENYKAHLFALYKLDSMFHKIETDLDITNKTPLIFYHPSISQAGNWLFRSQLNHNLPIIQNKEICILKGSSKYELILCKVLSELHQITCSQNLYNFKSLVTGSGSQYLDQQSKKLTLDFFCEISLFKSQSQIM